MSSNCHSLSLALLNIDTPVSSYHEIYNSLFDVLSDHHTDTTHDCTKVYYDEDGNDLYDEDADCEHCDTAFVSDIILHGDFSYGLTPFALDDLIPAIQSVCTECEGLSVLSFWEKSCSCDEGLTLPYAHPFSTLDVIKLSHWLRLGEHIPCIEKIFIPSGAFFLATDTDKSDYEHTLAFLYDTIEGTHFHDEDDFYLVLFEIIEII